MKTRIKILSMILAIAFICSSCGNDKNNIQISKSSAFAIEQNTFKLYLTIANKAEQTSDPFKVKIKINNPIISAALGFYEKELKESDRSKSPFVIEPYKEINMDQDFPLIQDIDETLIGDNIENSDKIPSVQIEIIGDDFTRTLPLDYF
ncbi:hypothetical protein EHE19_015485 [Ruminiclostridium herbifermentans]|uniref:Uncharacterized protein n=1 Tax=Ruminiclostridium herbifermentans TaxID=2488810 RepID=A0A4U7JLX5_9FIRM|nr:hypothetical protein [Ruminiclostridium herbifermentans]QNU66268.1 hypothetical protein EHE19_015485 [Ruminiclostridium herbifermentans]